MENHYQINQSFEGVCLSGTSQFSAAGRILALFRRKFAERCDVEVREEAENPLSKDRELRIALVRDANLETQGSFRIESAGPNLIRISGGDLSGLFAGIGKFLRTSRYAEKHFVPGPWRGTSVPALPVRGMYLTQNFSNFYVLAPLPEIYSYFEDLALWGYNAIVFAAFPVHLELGGVDHTEIALRVRALMKFIHSLELKTGFIYVSNMAESKDAPPEMRYEAYPDDWKKRGDAGMKICPSAKTGWDLLIREWNLLLDHFGDEAPDYICFWPYDAGGCGCQECWPWGFKGFLKLSAEYVRIARERYPNCQFILSAWMFDMPPCGEWEGLSAALANDRKGLDYILTDDDEDFPRYPLDTGVPGGLPLLSFPEIAMWGMWPWGGYGANPLPERFQRLWNQVKGKIQGGFPYSEGIWDDINKAIVTQFYWDPERTAEETLMEYIDFEFSPDVTEIVLRAIACLERNQTDRWSTDQESKPCAYDLLQEAEHKLPERARNSWRWRILFLRAFLDRERYKIEPSARFLGGNDWPTPACEPALRELRKIYHVNEMTDNAVRPPLLHEALLGDSALPAPITAVRA